MKGKVLVIEDNVDWQNLLRDFLEKAGYFVVIEASLELAINKISHELFHFITIDMQLDEDNTGKEKFEGWHILEVVKKLRIHQTTPTMVITGFESEYLELKKLKSVEGLFFMGKGNFDRTSFIETIDRVVAAKDLRFNDDHRGTV